MKANLNSSSNTWMPSNFFIFKSVSTTDKLRIIGQIIYSLLNGNTSFSDYSVGLFLNRQNNSFKLLNLKAILNDFEKSTDLIGDSEFKKALKSLPDNNYKNIPSVSSIMLNRFNTMIPLSSGQKSELQLHYAQHLQHKLQHNHQGIVVYNGTTYKKTPTEGDGSCGLHAMLGERTVFGVKDKNVTEHRAQFANFVREQEILPEFADTLIKDAYLKAQLNEPDEHLGLFHYYANDYMHLSAEEFCSHPVVKEAYCMQLEQTTYFLNQPELLAAAEFFRVNMILVQPEVGYDVFEVGISSANPLLVDLPPVLVWYNGINHYERMVPHD